MSVFTHAIYRSCVEIELLLHEPVVATQSSRLLKQCRLSQLAEPEVFESLLEFSPRADAWVAKIGCLYLRDFLSFIVVSVHYRDAGAPKGMHGC